MVMMALMEGLGAKEVGRGTGGGIRSLALPKRVGVISVVLERIGVRSQMSKKKHCAAAASS